MNLTQIPFAGKQKQSNRSQGGERRERERNQNGETYTCIHTHTHKLLTCQYLPFVPLLEKDKRNHQYLPRDLEVQDWSLKDGPPPKKKEKKRNLSGKVLLKVFFNFFTKHCQKWAVTAYR